MEFLDAHAHQQVGDVMDTVERKAIRLILKCIVSIYSASSQAINEKIVGIISTDKQLGLDLKMLATEDKMLAFYVNVLGVE